MFLNCTLYASPPFGMISDAPGVGLFFLKCSSISEYHVLTESFGLPLSRMGLPVKFNPRTAQYTEPFPITHVLLSQPPIPSLFQKLNTEGFYPDSLCPFSSREISTSAVFSLVDILLGFRLKNVQSLTTETQMFWFEFPNV